MNSKKYSVVVGIALLSSSVMANELATKSPYDWTGVYVGGFIGGATGADVTNTATRNIDGTLWNIPAMQTTIIVQKQALSVEAQSAITGTLEKRLMS